MANVTILIPDALVPALAEAIAREQGSPVPTTDSERLALFRQWVKARAKEAMRNDKASRAAQAAYDDPNDPTVQW